MAAWNPAQAEGRGLMPTLYAILAFTAICLANCTTDPATSPSTAKTDTTDADTCSYPTCAPDIKPPRPL